MRIFRFIFIAVFIFPLFANAAAKKDYNVLLITVDTFRYDRVGVYDNRFVKTPNIDALARKSYLFTRAFSHNPVTLPAHTNILTGTTPRYHGISDNTGFRLEDRFLTIAEFLRAEKYRTGAFIGAFPLDSRFGLDQGFDVYDDNYGTHNEMQLFFVERPAEKVIEPAVQWISKQRSLKQKWFTWIHLFDPHQPYLPPPPFRKDYRRDLYSGEVAYVDASLKTLFDFLEQQRVMDQTIIIITGDHGEALGEKGEDTHSYFAYNNTIHIPLIIYIPNSKPAVIAENVSHIDIFPTVCDILGLNPPPHLQGETLTPIIAGGKRSQKNRDIYFESLTAYLNRGWAPLYGIIRDNFKYIDSPIPEFYNIETDPQEDRNLAKQTALTQWKRDLAKLKIDLKSKLPVERSQTVDPEIRNKLKSLGYISETPVKAPGKFTPAQDLKTLLPLQNRMLEAVGKYQDGQFQEAVTGLKAIIDENPGFVLVYRHIATIYMDYGQIQNAVDILKFGLRKNPSDINLMSKLGIILAEAGRPDEAIELLKYCVEKEGFNPDHWNFIGAAYYRKGKFRDALESYRKTIELDNNYASAYNNIGSLYLSIYRNKKDEQAFKLAMDNFSRAIEIDPRLFAAYNGRGAGYYSHSKPDEAIADWSKAIEIKPTFTEPYFNIAIAFIEKGDKTSAAKYLQMAKERLWNKLSDRDKQQWEKLIKESTR